MPRGYKGSWQKRVEAVAARRQDNQKKKQSSQDKKLHKQWFIELLNLLDRHSDSIIRMANKEKTTAMSGSSTSTNSRSTVAPSSTGGGTIHLWTTTVPTDAPPLLDLAAIDDGESANQGKKQQRPRSTSFGEQRESTGGGKGSKKKVHPRSAGGGGGGTGDAASEQTYNELPLACRSKFFRDKCTFSHAKKGGGGVGGCRFVHHGRGNYASLLSLGQILENTKVQNSKGESSIASGDIGHKAMLNKTNLNLAESAIIQAADAEQDGSHSGGMEMLYHVAIPLKNLMSVRSEERPDDPTDENNDKDTSTATLPVGEALGRQYLAQQQISMGSIVYVTLNDMLVYDRYQDGGVLYLDNERDFLQHVVGDDAFLRRRKSSIGGESGDDESAKELFSLPGSILEHILSFLPDSSVAVASQVCKNWHDEMDHTPQIWKHMLSRRHWPFDESAAESAVPNGSASPSGLTPPASGGIPSSSSDGDADREDLSSPYKVVESLRGTFLQHYAAMRDIEALRDAMNVMVMPSANVRGQPNSSANTSSTALMKKDMVYLEFAKLKYAPRWPNSCISVQVWSPSRIIAGYSHDCSVRLFEALPTGNGEEKRCKELVCQYMNPYRFTKKRSCRLMCMDVDDDAIASLCHVTDGQRGEAYIMVVVGREEFLLGESSSSAADAGGSSSTNGGSSGETNNGWTVVDIGEAFINYTLSCDEMGDRMLQLLDFITDGGEMSEIEVVVSPSMACCGNCRFMVEVTISIPVLTINTEDGEEEVTTQLLDRKLVLFSAHVGAIVWMGDSNPLDRGLRPRQEDMSLTYLRRPHPGASRPSCAFVVSSKGSPALIVGELSPTGDVHSPQRLEVAETMWIETLPPGWQIAVARHQRSIVITPTDIVTGDTIVHMVDDVIRDRKGVVAFLPRYPVKYDEPSFRSVVLDDMEIVRLGALRDDHVAVFCRRRSQQPPARNDTTNNEMLQNDIQLEQDQDNEIRGENGIQQRPAAQYISIFAVVLHVPTGREIFRTCLEGRVGQEEEEPVNVPRVSFASQEAVVGYGIASRGIVMTGRSVRKVGCQSDHAHLSSAGGDASSPTKSAKKKKKVRVKKAGKKDMFARGMSLRG